MILSSYLIAVSTLLCLDVDDARSVFDYSQPRVRYTNLAVSQQALSSSDVQRLGGLLNASDAQLQLMLAQYAEFVRQHNALLDREAPQLLSMSAGIHLAQKDEGGYTEAHSERMKTLLRHASRLRRQLEQVEQSYINTIEPFLTEEQVARLPLLRNEAVRRQCRVPPTTFPWTQFDVRAIWDSVDVSQLSPDDQQWVQDILWEHDLTATPLLRAMTDAYWRTAADISRDVGRLQSGVLPGDEYNRLYEHAKRPFLRSLQRIATLNENTVSQIVQTIPSHTADQFHRLAESAAYPELYPDPTALHSGFKAIIEDEQLARDVVMTVNELQPAYELEYEQLTTEIERFYLQWAERNVVGRDGYFRQHLPRALQPHLDRRSELAQRWLDRLAQAVGEPVLQRHGIGQQDDDEAGDSELDPDAAQGA